MKMILTRKPLRKKHIIFTMIILFVFSFSIACSEKTEELDQATEPDPTGTAGSGTTTTTNTTTIPAGTGDETGDATIPDNTGDGGEWYAIDGPVAPSTQKPATTSAAITKALNYIANIEDWRRSTNYAPPQGPVVTASFCGLALLASGSTPSSGTYSEAVKRAADYVAAHVNDIGMSGSWNQDNWHFTIGSIFLAEVVAVSSDSAYKNALQSAVQKIEASIESTGGFAHGPHTVCPLNYLELEIMSNWAIIAMGAAKRVGCSVSNTVLTNAIKYVENCTVSNGGVGYSTRANQRFGDPCRNGGAILGFCVAGAKSSSKLDSMVGYFLANTSKLSQGHGSPTMGFLGGALGCMACGQQAWDNYVSNFFQSIINHQSSNGLFASFGGDGGNYGQDDGVGLLYVTGIFTLVLQMDHGNLKFLGSGK